MLNILIAVYKGQDYLKQQIDSIVESANDVPFELTVSIDDAGSDSSVEVLSDNFSNINIVRVDEGKKFGSAKKNFSHLLSSCNRTYPYYMFSDQDDVWLKSKVKDSLSRMHELEQEYGKDIPFLVFTDAVVVDENLSIINNSFITYEKLNRKDYSSFKKMCMQNIAQGCTFLFNKPLLDLVDEIPESARMHDHWLALVACKFGKIDFYNTPTLLYRQHSRNEVGSKGFGIQTIKNKLIKNRASINNSIVSSLSQVEQFYKTYMHLLNTKDASFLLELADIRKKNKINRILFLLRHKIFMTNLTRTIGLYLFI